MATVEIKVQLSTENEGTNAPYWLLIDPIQMLRPDAGTVSRMIDGPFFSREEAEQFLRDHDYRYSKNAVVWCASGCNSKQYLDACYGAGIR